MSIFDKLKKAAGGVINRKKEEVEDKVVGKIVPGSTPSYSSGSTGQNYQAQQPSSVPKQDAEYEAKMEAMRKQKEMRAVELEMQMQERMMAQGGMIDQLMGAQAGVMNQVSQVLDEQNKKK